MKWPFTVRNHNLRAGDLDRMSLLRRQRITTNSWDTLRVTLEDNHFLIRREGTSSIMHRSKSGSDCEKFLSRYYNQLQKNRMDNS